MKEWNRVRAAEKRDGDKGGTKIEEFEKKLKRTNKRQMASNVKFIDSNKYLQWVFIFFQQNLSLVELGVNREISLNPEFPIAQSGQKLSSRSISDSETFSV